jgi:hypothetical protein
VFDYETGSLRHDQDNLGSHRIPRVVEAVRQICLLFKKIQIPCKEDRNTLAIENFINVERSFDDFLLQQSDTAKFLAVSDVLWGSLVYSLQNLPITPRHGPGATAEGISGNRKYRIRNWHERLDNYFPFYETCYVLSARDDRRIEDFPLIPVDQEIPVKVSLVPKTLKAPRIIAVEPVCMQYAQQALRSLLYDAIEEFELTSGHVNFTSQLINQQLAMSSSTTGRLATIDLSDASDRVPLDLALGMFRSSPDIQGAIEACRSRFAKLPDGRIIGPLKKFASMGSALCFPIESMYFYTICVAALLEYRGLPITRRNVFRVSRDVYVYGDDIIVPTYAAEFVLDNLRKYNCRPNPTKTFYSGKFRESCGMDAYDGWPVNPVYLRRVVPRTKLDASELVSWSATANLLFLKGYWRAAEFMHSQCEHILRVYPTIPKDSSGVGRIYTIGQKPKYRFNRNLQVREVRAWVVSPVIRKDPLDGYAALQKSLLNLSRKREGRAVTLEQFAKGDFIFPSDKQHLEHSAMYGACTLKLRWVPA